MTDPATDGCDGTSVMAAFSDRCVVRPDVSAACHELTAACRDRPGTAGDTVAPAATGRA